MIEKRFIAPNLPLFKNEYNSFEHDQFANVLRLYFNLLDDYLRIAALPPSGTTATRPTTNLVVGDYYFDTSLNLPIWYDGTDWIDAAGNVV